MVSLNLVAASVLNVEVQDALDVLKLKTTNGGRPDLAIGVWGVRGLYHPAHMTRGQGADKIYRYRLAIPRDTPLKLHIASRDLKLGDSLGALLPADSAGQTFQHATGDANPKRFVFTVLGLQPASASSGVAAVPRP